MKPSLLGRLELGLTVSLVSLFFVQWWLVTQAVKTVSESYVVSRLDHDAETVLTSISVLPSGAFEHDSQKVDFIYRKPFSGHYFQITTEDQLIRSRSLWDQQLEPPQDDQEVVYFDGPQEQPLLAKRYHYRLKGKPLDVLVAEDLSALIAGLERFEMRYAMVSVVLFILILISQAWVARQSLRPLLGVRQDIKALESGDVTQIREQGVPTEVLPLVREFNRLLEVIEQRLSRSRSALGNLAHSLKTPLTVLTRMADNEILQVHDEVRQELQSQTDKIRQLLDYQLKRARLAGSSAPGWQFRLTDELSPLVDTLQRMYVDKQIDIQLDIPEGKMYSGDREDLLELFGNLLDNACKWAKQKVVLTVKNESGLFFMIEDDGPGCPTETCDELVQRGKRLDESTLGHGLGLAIVKDIVEQYGGQLKLGRSEELGGFMVMISLPSRASD